MTEGHNNMSRSDIIREIKKELDACAEKAANIAKVRKTLKGRIKAELGFKVADWDAMVRMAELEQESRDSLMTVIREGFQALNVGEQLSFLDAVDAKPDAPAKAKGRRKTKAEEIAEIVREQEAEDAETRAELDRQRSEDDTAFDDVVVE